MSKTVLAQIDGFTPLMDGVVADVGVIPAAVFGKMWRFCQMKDGVCRAGQERIADELGLTRPTVNAHIDRLCEAGYLKDLTPDLKGLPHEYQDTGKANLSINFTGTCKKDLQPPVKNLYTKKELKKENNMGEKTSPVLPGGQALSIENQIASGVKKVKIPKDQADASFSAECDIAAMNICRGAANLEPLCMAYFEARHILPTKSEYAGWRKAFTQMSQKKVRAEHVTGACQKLKSAGMTNSSPFSVINTAVDLANPAPGQKAECFRAPVMMD